MKIVKFPKGYIISAFDGPTESITPELLDQIMTPIEVNKAKIFDIAMDIERVMNSIITHHFFQRNDDLKEQSTEFTNQILDSDWCTFSSKKKLLSHIINSKEYLKGIDKSKFDALLKKVMSCRNAFAHGELSTDGREVKLKYFEGNSIAKTLTDEYFSQIEKDINDCWKLINEVAITSGASTTINV